MRPSATSIRPSSSAPSIAVAGMSRRSAAASTVARSPESSAAARSEQRADLLGGRLDAARVRALDQAGDRDRRIHALLELAEPAQLGDRERQPLGPAEDLLHPARGGFAADQSRRQQSRRLAVEHLDRQLLESRGVERRHRLVTRGQDHPDRRAGEPATREQQRVERRRVQPMHVVDAREHRPLGRREQTSTARVAAPTRKRSRSTAGTRPSAPPSAVALRTAAAREGDPAPGAAPRAPRRTPPRPRPGCRRRATP